MPELLKNMYNYHSIHDFAVRFKSTYPLFQVDDFIQDIMDETWDDLGLKARMRKITLNLGKYLPSDYKEALSIIDKVLASYPKGTSDFTLMCFPDFVEVFGQDEHHWDLSIAALKKYTPYSSSEFAIRPFIIKHEDRMIKEMMIWAKHDNEHVRRLASEGSRPMLPWGQALTSFKKDPTPILGILEQLKKDSSLYVRKSVANSLNDISKTHPDLLVSIAKDWYGKDKNTDWIVKHGCRTLLKKGNKDVLSIFGFIDAHCLNVSDFQISNTVISVGDTIHFSFKIAAHKAYNVRMEYGIDYMKASGKRNRKIFQISEIALKKDELRVYNKSHSFADVSTRKHYLGTHSITLIVNGVAQGTLDFEVIKKQ